MMKSLLRRATTLGLIGSVVVTSWLGTTLKALGIPESEITKLLSPIPVFMIVNGEGFPLVLQQNDTQQKFTLAFVSEDDANTAYDQFKQENPNESQAFKVMGVPLPEVYKLQVESAKEEDGLKVQYVPTAEEVQVAQQLLPDGQEYRGGVPLFVAKIPDEGYVTIEDSSNNNERVILFFFEKEQIQEFIEGLEKNNPNFPDNVEIEVALLENIMAALTTQDNEFLTKIRFVPSEDAAAYVRQAIQNQQGN
ncbi:MAG: Tic22 family protein [Microcystaceae cyanobacterium]